MPLRSLLKLQLETNRGVSDLGVQGLAKISRLRELNFSGTAIKNVSHAAVAAIRGLCLLEVVSCHEVSHDALGELKTRKLLTIR
jgi:hypothetical protein